MSFADLRPLPYATDALAPFLDAETVRLHHGTHQEAYVKGWNETEGALRHIEARTTCRNRLRSLYEDLVFNGAGVILHEMYWENLCPARDSGMPSKAFDKCARRCFGSPQNLIDTLIEVGTAIHGSGWVILAWIPRFDRMVILPVQEHEMRWIPGAVPLIVIDVWAHAYYLQYPAGRRKYLQDIWQYINWNAVNRRYAGRSSSGF